MQDYQACAQARGLELSEAARNMLVRAEEAAKRHDCRPSPALYLSMLLRGSGELRDLMARHGLDADVAAAIASDHAFEQHSDPWWRYDASEDDLFSDPRGPGARSLIGQAALSNVLKAERDSITRLDILAGVLGTLEADAPVLENDGWKDPGLQVPFFTLSHFVYRHHPELWLRIDTVRSELALRSPGLQRGEHVLAAPPNVRPALRRFFADHPDRRRNCFLIMPFAESTEMTELHAALRSLFADFGFDLLRADDKPYDDTLFVNVEAYMHGCRFGVSVHEQGTSPTHNANVALEVGYMLGMGREVCILKERDLPALPSDLQGRLFTPYDRSAVTASVRVNIEKWLRERQILPPGRES